MDEIEQRMSPWLQAHSCRAAVEELRAAGVPSAVVNPASEALRHPSVLSRRMLIDVEHAFVGHAQVVGNPIKASVEPRLQEVSRIPRLGENTRAVLRDVLGYADGFVDELVADGVVYES